MAKELIEKYKDYPPKIKTELYGVRELILRIATNTKGIDFIGEQLKWGEPSFVTKTSGTTLRLDWKKENLNEISLYFNCNSKVSTILKKMYPDDFNFIGSRELRLPIDGKYSTEKLGKCIELILKYHLIKSNF